VAERKEARRRKRWLSQGKGDLRGGEDTSHRVDWPGQQSNLGQEKIPKQSPLSAARDYEEKGG